MFKYLILILLTIIKLSATTCCDGSYSSSTGRGTCSHHGGVCEETSTYTTPNIPTSLKASCENQNIQLSWNSSYNSSFYKIYYSENCNSSYTYLDDTSLTHYTAFFKNDNVCFKIKACTYSSCSSYSNFAQCKFKITFNYNSDNARIIDGDTIEFYDRTCRLYGIDTPETYYSSKLYDDAEICQIDEDIIIESGKKSKNFIEELIKDEDLNIKIIGKDNYNRDICDINLSDGKNLSEELLKNGYAITWDKYIKNNTVLESYREFQNNAKISSKGLWNDSYNVISCLSDKKSIFDNDREFALENLAISTQNMDNGYKKIIVNYQNSGDNIFIINNNSNFELKENEIYISDKTNDVSIYSNGHIKIINKSIIETTTNLITENNKTIISYDFNTSLSDNNFEYTQMIDKNMIKYLIDDILQFTIYYFKNSLMSIKHKDYSRFKNDINISTDSKVWIDSESDTKSLYILTNSSNTIEF